jgi:tetratricopeptide (TPR) repeat protein
MMQMDWINKALVVLLALAGPVVSAAEPEPGAGVSGIWDDPTFRKQFLGSYGFQSEIEPAVDPDEQLLLQEIIPLFPDQLDLAAERLIEITAPPEPEEPMNGKGNGKKKKKAKKTAEPVKPASAVFDFLLGNVYYQKQLQGDGGVELLDRAVPHYETAILKFPSYRRAHKNLGLIHVQRNRFEEAIEPLSRVIQLGGGDGLTYGLLGYAYMASNQFVAAESAYRSAMLLQPEVLEWKLGLTQSVAKQGKYAEAVALGQELIEREPERADLWLLQANAYIGMDRPIEAAQNYEILHRMGRATTASLHTLGDIYVNQEMWEMAARAYAAALEQDPEQDPSRLLRNVEALAQRGALDQAKTLLDITRDRLDGRIAGPDRARALKLEARIAVASGRDDAAVEVLEKIVALDPLDGEALILLGQHYAKVEQEDRAAFYYERAANLEEFEADAKVRHAQLLVGQTRYDEAVPLLKRAQELKPRDDVARYLEQVERVARSRP